MNPAMIYVFLLGVAAVAMVVEDLVEPTRDRAGLMASVMWFAAAMALLLMQQDSSDSLFAQAVAVGSIILVAMVGAGLAIYALVINPVPVIRRAAD